METPIHTYHTSIYRYTTVFLSEHFHVYDVIKCTAEMWMLQQGTTIFLQHSNIFSEMYPDICSGCMADLHKRGNGAIGLGLFSLSAR